MSEEVYQPKQIRYTKSGKPAKNKESNTYKGLVQPRYHITPIEYDVIKKRAEESGLSLNEYTRRRLLGHPVYSAEAFHVVGLLQAIHSRLWGMKSEDRHVKYEVMTEIRQAVEEGQRLIGLWFEEKEVKDDSDYEI